MNDSRELADFASLRGSAAWDRVFVFVAILSGAVASLLVGGASGALRIILATACSGVVVVGAALTVRSVAHRRAILAWGAIASLGALAAVSPGDAGRTALLLLVPVAWLALEEDGGVMSALASVAGAAVVAGSAFGAGASLASIAAQAAMFAIGAFALAGAVAGFIARLRYTTAVQAEALRQQTLLGLIADELYGTLDPDAVLQRATDAATRLIGATGRGSRRAEFVLIEDGMVSVVARSDEDPLNATDEYSYPQSAHPALTSALSGHRVVVFRPRDITDGSLPRIRAEGTGTSAGVAVHIRLEGPVEAVLIVMRRGLVDFTPPELSRLREFASIVELAIANALGHARLAGSITTDEVTALPNHDEFARRVASVPRGVPYAVVVARLDAETGELSTTTLAGLARRAREQMRAGDVLGRTAANEVSALVHHADDASIDSLVKRLAGIAATSGVSVRAGACVGESGAAADLVLAGAAAALDEADAGSQPLHVNRQRGHISGHTPAPATRRRAKTRGRRSGGDTL